MSYVNSIQKFPNQKFMCNSEVYFRKFQFVSLEISTLNLWNFGNCFCKVQVQIVDDNNNNNDDGDNDDDNNNNNDNNNSNNNNNNNNDNDKSKNNSGILCRVINFVFDL